MIRKISLIAGLLSIPLLFTQLHASEVNITENTPFIDVTVNGKTIRIERIQDTKHKLKNSYTKTSRPAPPFSIQPFQPIEGIKTISELDVLDFMKNELSNNKGKLIDARITKWYKAGSLPHAVNIPFPVFSPKGNKQLLGQIFSIFNVEKKDKKWIFNEAQTLLIFDNGPWCKQGEKAMKNLVELGYPKSKILYYRGGMQYWQILGLTTIQP